MYKTATVFLALVSFLSGCTGISKMPDNGEMFGLNGTINVPNCAPYAGSPPVCSGPKNDPKVMINLDTDPFEIVPKCVNAKKGKTIKITLISSEPIAKNSVIIFPKEPQNYLWLARTNSSRDTTKIKIKVKSGSDFPTGEYAYSIWTKAQCVDPRIKVEN